MKLIVIHFFLLFYFIHASTVYDSYLNIYKEDEFSDLKYSEISNTTWKEFFISENVTNLIKCIPVYIDNDKELDLLVLDSESRLYWVSNIRGTSKEVKHQFISRQKLHDFVISDQVKYYNERKSDDFYILGINSKRDKILKFTESEHMNQNFTKSWKENHFLDINDSGLAIAPFIRYSDIISIHLSQFDENPNKQLLLVGLQNYYDYSTNLLKIIIINEKIDNIALIKFMKKVRVIGAYDMNKDGLIDILYVDSSNKLFIMVNDDPYYWHVAVGTLNTVTVRNTPRLFIIDADGDNYPDIVAADKTQNTIGILFNNGLDYWDKVKKFYSMSKNKEEIFSTHPWTFIPLIDVYEENIYNQEIRDFTLFQITSDRRINFEIFAIFQNKIYWFVEKELNVPSMAWGDHKMKENYMYCMVKCNIVVDQQGADNSLDYHFILDIDINNDDYPEFILYSSRDNSLYWIKKYEPNLTGFGWNSNFWIYLIVYIYFISSFIGMFEFYRLKKLNDKMAAEKLLKEENKQYNSDVPLYPPF